MRHKQSRSSLIDALMCSLPAKTEQKRNKVSQNPEKTLPRIDISPKELEELECSNFSEQQIAEKLGCSRMGLYQYRKRIGCPQKTRQGKGMSRYTETEKKEIANRIQRGHNNRLIAKYGSSTRGRNREEQQAIVFSVLGRRLKANECLHHVDNNPANNVHNNLVICTRAYHRSVFHTKDAQNKISNYKVF